MTPQERAEQIVKSVFTDNERGWRDWYAVANSGSAQQPVPKGTAQRLVDAVALEITQTRRTALLEVSRRLLPNAQSAMLDAPCLWCGYNGEGYWQPTTHELTCPWHNVGGRFDRLDRLAQEG